MKDFIKDIIDIDFNMPFHKWCIGLAIIFFSIGAGCVVGAYIDIYLKGMGF